MIGYLKFLTFNAIILALAFLLSRYEPTLMRLAADPDAALALKYSVPFVPELITALTIAVVLNIGVEWITRQRHHELEEATIKRLNTAVAKNSLLQVFNENLPPNLVEQIKRHLLDAQVCKLVWEATYRLELKPDPKEGSKQLVFWTATDKYTLKNMSRLTVPHDITMEAEIPPGQPTQLWHITALKVRGTAQPFQEERDGQLIRASHSLRLKPGEEVEIETVQTGSGPLASQEVLCSALPVETLTLRVQYPAELFAWATSLHPDSEQEQRAPAGERCWKLDAVLPGQGIELLWRPN